MDAETTAERAVIAKVIVVVAVTDGDLGPLVTVMADPRGENLR